jgi:hypothetical protein
MNLTSIAAVAGLIFGSIGTCLGVYNTWKAGQKDKVRLKVTPKIYQIRPNGRFCSSRIPEDFSQRWDGLCLEIVNVGFLTVSIDEIGLIQNADQRIVFPKPEISGNESLPKRLEPRTSVTCYIPSKSPSSFLQEGLPYAKCFYASTACGVTVQGNSKVSKWLIKRGKANYG